MSLSNTDTPNREKTQKWDKKSLIIKELTQGKELAKQLENHLDSSFSTGKMLLIKLLSSFDKSIFMLNLVESEDEPQLTGPTTESRRSTVSGTLQIDQYDFELGDYNSKDRRTMPRWTEQVRICATANIDGRLDNGYSWRKYGQKEILGAKYQRGYYRCTHRNVQGCLAVKQVQRSDEDASIVNITYRGRHTCIQASQLIEAQSPNKQDTKQDQINKKRKTQEFFINFQGHNLDKKEFNWTSSSSSSSFPSTSLNENQISSSSSLKPNNNISISSPSPPSLSTPTTSESTCGRNKFNDGEKLQTSDSDLYEIISATSALETPYPDLDFLMNFDSDFLVDSPLFFS